VKKILAGRAVIAAEGGFAGSRCARAAACARAAIIAEYLFCPRDSCEHAGWREHAGGWEAPNWNAKEHRMSLMSFISKQFIDIIQWTEDAPGTLAYRLPMQDKEIQNGGQLVVRETQRAAFFNEGKFADQFGAGTYTLNTRTLPILTYLQNWDKLFESPFKSDVYFFSLREQIDQKWGTTQPITIRDKEYGPLRIRAHGVYSYRIADVVPFWTKLCGTAERYTVTDVEGQIRSAILTSMASFLGGSDVAFVDMAANQELFSSKVREAVAPVFQDFGLELRSFYVQSLSLPEELQQHLDKAASMRLVGDMQKYTQFQAAESLPVAAANAGGAAGAGVGIGAGLGMGQMMAQSIASAAGGQAPGAAAAPAAEDPFQTLEKLADLLKKGVLTQAEFDAKKTELLKKIQ
jgi:membrane protease subunit (stomatin/prohibitin family)